MVGGNGNYRASLVTFFENGSQRTIIRSSSHLFSRSLSKQTPRLSLRLKQNVMTVKGESIVTLYSVIRVNGWI